MKSSNNSENTSDNSSYDIETYIPTSVYIQPGTNCNKFHNAVFKEFLDRDSYQSKFQFDRFSQDNCYNSTLFVVENYPLEICSTHSFMLNYHRDQFCQKLNNNALYQFNNGIKSPIFYYFINCRFERLPCFCNIKTIVPTTLAMGSLSNRPVTTSSQNTYVNMINEQQRNVEKYFSNDERFLSLPQDIQSTHFLSHLELFIRHTLFKIINDIIKNAVANNQFFICDDIQTTGLLIIPYDLLVLIASFAGYNLCSSYYNLIKSFLMPNINNTNCFQYFDFENIISVYNNCHLAKTFLIYLIQCDKISCRMICLCKLMYNEFCRRNYLPNKPETDILFNGPNDDFDNDNEFFKAIDHVPSFKALIRNNCSSQTRNNRSKYFVIPSLAATEFRNFPSNLPPIKLPDFIQHLVTLDFLLNSESSYPQASIRGSGLDLSCFKDYIHLEYFLELLG